jgi:hypothetical protein
MIIMAMIAIGCAAKGHPYSLLQLFHCCTTTRAL